MNNFYRIYEYPFYRIRKREPHVTLEITDEAFVKMISLVNNFDTEIAWHGCASRDLETMTYTIDDIIVYPQTVTSATVETDQAQYEQWLFSLPDEVFNSIRMQGHSHVYMGAYPSGVDTGYYEKIIKQVKDDFYIFLILNKHYDKYLMIYDGNLKRRFYENEIKVRLKTSWVTEITLEEAREMIS